jgi:UDP-2-acetamido-2-deoxy-ribo-hexuluronate aminotransferase
VEFVDLEAQQELIRDKIDARIKKVLDHGQYIMGPEVAELESQLAAYVGTKHCITASSGSDTLLMALLALDIGPGDEVITSPFTFIATGEMIQLVGAVPVFVDIDPKTYNIDPSRIEAAITDRTKAIIPVSIFGQCSDMASINVIASAHDLPVIEDGAQSFGARCDGERSCGLSTIGSTSFFPSKPLGAYGDGGALFTDDESIALKLKEIRVHGQEKRYYHTRVGINGRMDTLQAAVVLAKMQVFEDEVRKRAEIGARYSERLQEINEIVVPYLAPGHTSVYAQYTIQVENRSSLAEALKEKGIPTAVHYPVPLHRQPVMKDAFRATDLSHAELLSERVISLPMGPYLTTKDQDHVVESIHLVLSSKVSTQ